MTVLGSAELASLSHYYTGNKPPLMICQVLSSMNRTVYWESESDLGVVWR